MKQYDVNNISVSSILSEIRESLIAIPEMQRPFVWNPTKVRDLIDSLYRGYPIGYIITWKNPDVRLKDGTSAAGKKVIIDGQQRLTALSAALVGYEVVGNDYRRKRIRIAFNPVEKRFETCNPAIEKNAEWIPDISVVMKPAFDAYTAVNDYCDLNGITDNQKRSEINRAVNDLCQVQNNDIGVISIHSELDIDSVTDIFIRINSEGKALSQADFAMSKISSNETLQGDRIRKTIDYFCHLKQSPNDFAAISRDTEFTATDEFRAIQWIKDEPEDVYAPTYTDVLRVAFTSKFHRGKLADLVSLLSGRDFTERVYREEIAEQSFRNLKEGVLAFVSKTNFQRYIMILKSVGLIDPSLSRSMNALNFGYVLFLALREKKTEPAVIEKAVRRWVVLSMLTGRYSGSAETKFNDDIREFASHENPLDYIDDVEAGELSDAFWNNVLISRLTTTSTGSQSFKIYCAAQIKAGDRGFLSEHIEVKSLIEQRGDIHHIFPKNYLTENGITDKEVLNQIANFAFAQSEVNIRISDMAPHVYMDIVRKQCEDKVPVIGGITDSGELGKNLEVNCIPADFMQMKAEDYERFLCKRRILMARKIKGYYENLK